MPQDYYDPLQVFDYITDRLEANKSQLGIRYVAKLSEDLLPEYPAILVSMERPMERTEHATQMFKVEFNLDIWVFHATLTVKKQIRGREDIILATNIRKFLHADYNLSGHIIFGFVNGEFPGITTQIAGTKTSQVVTTRLTWTGENRVLYKDS